jgi:hypothetical protein
MKRLTNPEADSHAQRGVRGETLTTPTTSDARCKTDVLALDPERREALVSQLEYLLRTHGDEQALSEQSSLQDVVTELRHLAGDLGLDFVAAVAGSNEAPGEPTTYAAFDPRI